MSGDSNVGNAGTYQHDDQRNIPDSLIEEEKKDNRFEEGKENAHLANDSKDERSIANKLAAETSKAEEDGSGKPKTKEDKLRDIDATLPALSHGNKPSRGAIIDQQIREEEEEELRRKGKA